MTAIIATILILLLSALLSVGCRTRIELSDFTVPNLVVNYEGDWAFYKKRGEKPADYVLATVVNDSVITADEVGRAGDFYIVEEDGRSDIMSPERFIEHYIKVKRLKLPPREE
jgi:hypothetical protein